MDPHSNTQSGFQEIFNNQYITRSAPRVIYSLSLSTFLGVFFAALLLATFSANIIWLIYLFSGWAPFDIIKQKEPPATGEFITGFFLMLFFLYMAVFFLGRAKRVFFSRLYLSAGYPLESVTAPTEFEFDDEYCRGIAVDSKFFSFDDCWLTDLRKKRIMPSDGLVRIWYVPTTGVLVRAELKA